MIDKFKTKCYNLYRLKSMNGFKVPLALPPLLLPGWACLFAWANAGDDMKRIDLHCHGLYGLDDGAPDRETAQRMLELAYADGTRVLCFTPHFHPGYYGDSSDAALRRLEELQDYAAGRYGDLTLCLGNELYYDPACVAWLDAGKCRTLNKSRYLLVDFSRSVSAYAAVRGLEQLLGWGYRPVLAHVELYPALRGELRILEDLTRRGVLLQLDAQSVLGDFGLGARLAARRLLRRGLADVIASDGHDLSERPPRLSSCCRLIEEKFGAAYARRLFWENPERILKDQEVGKD